MGAPLTTTPSYAPAPDEPAGFRRRRDPRPEDLMSSITSLTNIAQSALMAQETAMQVVGQNIANAQTPGYSRETLSLQASTPEQTPIGVPGDRRHDRGDHARPERPARPDSTARSRRRPRRTRSGARSSGRSRTCSVSRRRRGWRTRWTASSARGASWRRTRPTRARRPWCSRRARSSRRRSTITPRSSRTSRPARARGSPTRSRS